MTGVWASLPPGFPGFGLEAMTMSASKETTFAYQAVYRYLIEWIETANPETELRLPSLRELAQRLNVSVSTTKYAYSLLEDEGRIYARPKQGYFTRVMPVVPVDEKAPNLLDDVFASARRPGMLALSSDAPAMLLSLDNPLLMIERELTRQYPRVLAPLYQPFGEPELRSVLADRYTLSTERYWRAEHVYIGSDLRSVLELSLEALQLVGGVALVESPCSWVILRQLQAARIRVIEMPLGDDGRFDLEQVWSLLQREPIRLAVLSSKVSLPHGSLMPAQDKRILGGWLAERGIWLFENDSYGELCFVPEAARYRDHADPERLLVFSTLDKLIGSEAPYGYVLVRRHGVEFQRRFLERAFRLSPIRQRAIAKLFASRRIDQHTRMLRGLLCDRMTHMKALLDSRVGELLKVIPPQGGAAFWAESARPVDMRRVYERLLAQRIVIAPGEIFSQCGAWPRHLRLSFTLDWSKDIAQALSQLAWAIEREAGIN